MILIDNKVTTSPAKIPEQSTLKVKEVVIEDLNGEKDSPKVAEKSNNNNQTVVDLEEAHYELVKRLHAVRKIPKMIEANCSQEKETLLDPISSEEEFYLSHLNKTFDHNEEQKKPVVNKGAKVVDGVDSAH